MAGCTHAVARAACVPTAAGCSAVHTALRTASGRCCRGRPRTSDEPALPGSAHAHGALGAPRWAAGESRSGPFSRSDPTRTIPIVTHTRMPPAAVARAQSSCAHRCIPHGQPNERSRMRLQLTRLSGPHIGRHGPLCATVTCEDPDAHSQSAEDGIEAISLCAPQTGVADQLTPA
jgi:hypothetical protein